MSSSVRRRAWPRAAILFISILVVSSWERPHGGAPMTIGVGSDLMSTVGVAGQTYVDFSEGPIPADFFFPGSPAFDGVIQLKGRPLSRTAALRPQRFLGTTDTIVQRLERVTLDGPGSHQEIQIELVAMSLESTSPIDVGGQLFDVQFQASANSNEQDSGRAVFRRISTFNVLVDQTFPVRGNFIFTGVPATNSGSRLPRTAQNMLWGDYFIINTQNSVIGMNPVFGDGLVHIEGASTMLADGTPVPATTSRYTFYGRYTQVEFSDDREPLKSTWAPRYLDTFERFRISEPPTARGSGNADRPRLAGQIMLVPAKPEEFADADDDGFVDPLDNCPEAFNPQQEDGDEDLIGDACDTEVLYLPYLQAGDGTFTGFAAANLSDERETLRWEARSADGSLAPFPVNAARIPLEPGSQLARQSHEIFGLEPGESHSAWIRLTAPTRQLGAFFQCGTDTLSQLDGAVPLEAKVTRFYLSRVFQGPTAYRGRPARTLISVANPNETAIEIRFLLFTGSVPGEVGSGPALRTDGGATLVRTSPAARDHPILSNFAVIDAVPAGGFILTSVEELFPEAGEITAGYIVGEVVEGQGGVAAFELIELLDRDTVIGLSATLPPRKDHSFSAQLASVGDLFTNVNLVNAATTPREVVLTAVGADGNRLAEPVKRLLQPGQQLSEDAASLFSLSPSSMATSASQEVPFVGSLIVSSAAGVIGDVLFGDDKNADYAAGLLLQSQTMTQAIFNQVANVPGFFTGLAFFVPGTEGAEITIQVFQADGTLVGRAVENLGPGQRTSKLVDEYVPESAGQAGGFVRFEASVGVVAQLLFLAQDGQGQLKLFSAVPPTVIQ